MEMRGLSDTEPEAVSHRSHWESSGCRAEHSEFFTSLVSLHNTSWPPQGHKNKANTTQTRKISGKMMQENCLAWPREMATVRFLIPASSSEVEEKQRARFPIGFPIFLRGFVGPMLASTVHLNALISIRPRRSRHSCTNTKSQNPKKSTPAKRWLHDPILLRTAAVETPKLPNDTMVMSGARDPRSEYHTLTPSSARCSHVDNAAAPSDFQSVVTHFNMRASIAFCVIHSGMNLAVANDVSRPQAEGEVHSVYSLLNLTVQRMFDRIPELGVVAVANIVDVRRLHASHRIVLRKPFLAIVWLIWIPVIDL